MRLLRLVPLLLAALPLILAKDECKKGEEKFDKGVMKHCQSGYWKGDKICPEHCKVIDGHCQCVPWGTKAEAVAARDVAVGSCGVPNTHRCDDNSNLQVCNGHGAWTTLEHCLEDKHEVCYVDKSIKKGGGCRAAIASRDSPPLPERYTAGELCFNTTRCKDNKVQHCPEPNTWTLKKQCPTGQVCVQDCASQGCTARCHAVPSGLDPIYPDCDPGKYKCDYTLAILLTCNKFKQWQTAEICPKAGDCKPGAVGEAHCERAELPPLKPTTPGYAPPSPVASSSTDTLLHMLPVSLPSFSFKSDLSSVASSDLPTATTPASSTEVPSSAPASSVTPAPAPAPSTPAASSTSIDTDTIPHGPPEPIPQPTIKTSIISLRSTTATSSSPSIDTDTVPHAPPEPIPNPTSITSVQITTTTSSSSSIDTDTVPHAPAPPIPNPTIITSVKPPSWSSCSYSVINSDMPHGPPPSCFKFNTTSVVSSPVSASTLSSSIISIPAKPTPACKIGEGRCTADNHIENCIAVDGVPAWKVVKACPAGLECRVNFDGRKSLNYAKCDKPIEELLRHAKNRTAGAPELCDQPGNDRCEYGDTLDHVERCFKARGIQAWWEINTCPVGTSCLADIYEASGTVIASCVTDPKISRRTSSTARALALPPPNSVYGNCTEAEQYAFKCVSNAAGLAVIAACTRYSKLDPQFYWVTEQVCAKDKICYIEADGINAHCQYPDDMPGKPFCQKWDKTCSADKKSQLKCNVERKQWDLELICTEGGECVEDTPLRARCSRGGVHPAPSPGAPGDCLPWARKCSDDLSYVFVCNAQHVWEKEFDCRQEGIQDHIYHGVKCVKDSETVARCDWGSGPVSSSSVVSVRTSLALMPEPTYVVSKRTPRADPSTPSFGDCTKADKGTYKCVPQPDNSTLLLRCTSLALEPRGPLKWYRTRICPSHLVCAVETIEYVSNGRCLYARDDPAMPGKCQDPEKVCSDDGKNLLKCDLKTLDWTLESICREDSMRPGVYCEENGYRRATCPDSGIRLSLAAWTTSTVAPTPTARNEVAALPIRSDGYAPPPECTKGDGVCDSERRWLFTCGDDGRWEKEPYRCFAPGWCKMWDYGGDGEKLTCAGWPQYADTETCEGACESYDYMYCEAGKTGDLAAVELCRVKMCASTQRTCTGCDRCTYIPPYGLEIVPDMRTFVPGNHTLQVDSGS